MSSYCAVPDSQRERFYEHTSYAFAPERGILEYDPEEESSRADIGSRRGIYHGVDPNTGEGGVGRLEDVDDPPDPRTVCCHYWLETRIRGSTHSTPGLSAVATPPEHRREGNVRRLLAASLAEYRDRGATFSILWPFRYRFYNRYGWDTTNHYLRVTCDPADLGFARDAIDGDGQRGEFRSLEADDWTVLDQVHERWASRYDLSIVRDEPWWRHFVFERWTTDPFVYVLEREGEAVGYIVYTIDGERGDRKMAVSELAFVDRPAFFALLAFCADHDSQVDEVQIRQPTDTLFDDLHPSQHALEVERNTGPMARIVDVERTLSALDYPAIEETVSLAVTDPLVDWNDGTFGLEVDHGTGVCARADDHRSTATLDVSALSQLAVGARSVSALERAGRLSASDDVLDSLDRLFPRRTVFLDDGF